MICMGRAEMTKLIPCSSCGVNNAEITARTAVIIDVVCKCQAEDEPRRLTLTTADIEAMAARWLHNEHKKEHHGD